MNEEKIKQEESGNIDINTDENLSGTTHLNEPLSDENEADKWKAEADAWKDKYLRSVAEFDNFKRRSAKELREWMQTAGKEIILDLLEVLDDFDRAQQQLEKSGDAEALKQGVMLVFNKLRTALQNRGVKAMESIHQPFDPDLHDAVSEIKAPTEELKGKVLDEITKGYFMNDKIIRHAKVVVGK